MWKDLRFSFRALRRNPLVTAVAIASLALGIGANTAIFSLLEQIVLRSLPVQDPERLVVLHTEFKAGGNSTVDSAESGVASYPLYRDLRDSDKAFAGLIARAGAAARVSWHGETQSGRAEIVSGNFFQVLGVRAAKGRLLQPADDAAGVNPVVVFRYGYWQLKFGGAPEILNDTVNVNGHPMRVVGVAAPEFNGLQQGQLPDIYLPISSQHLAVPTLDLLDKPDFRWLVLFARLAPGVSLSRAQAMTDAAYRSVLERELGSGKVSADDHAGFLNGRAQLKPAAQGISEMREKWEKPLDVLMVMVGLVLLIACANVAGLLTARAAGRRREISIRLALGASRGALVKQLLIEGLLLSLCGAAVGLLVETWCSEGLVSLLPKQAGGAWIVACASPQLVAFSVGVAVLCGILFSMAPALQSTQPVLVSALNERNSQISPGQAQLRRILVTSQIALATLLAAGAGLFAMSFANQLHINLGYRTGRMLNFGVNATLDRPRTDSATAFYQDLLQRLQNRAGFRAVAAAAGGPFGGGTQSSNLTVQGYQPGPRENPMTTVVRVSPRFFEALSIPLLAGREFTSHDTPSSQKTAIVNQQFVNHYFAGRNPIGQRIGFGNGDETKLDIEVVGVVADSRIGVMEKPDITIYTPYTQWDLAQRLFFYVRTASAEDTAAAGVVRIVHEADPDLPAPEPKSIDVRIHEALYTERLIALLSASFGALAALLAAIGVYGMMANAVARRTPEIGLRIALGAKPQDVRRMVMREAARTVAIGLAIGIAGALILGRVVESQLYAVSGSDPAVLTGAALLLAIIGLTAAAVPGWRASRIDPLEALRYE